jgi:hypothetical protein
MKEDRNCPCSNGNARVRAGVACTGVLWLAGILVPCRAAITTALVKNNFDSQMLPAVRKWYAQNGAMGGKSKSPAKVRTGKQSAKQVEWRKGGPRKPK